MTTVLAIVQSVQDRIGVPRAPSGFGSTDQTTRQLLALLEEELIDLGLATKWQELKVEHTFTTQAQAEQVGAVPDDLAYFLPGTFYNRTTRRPMVGPIDEQEWQAIQSLPIYNRVHLAWRQRGNVFLITPEPAAGEVIAFEYITRATVRDMEGALKRVPTNDNDTPLLDPELIRLGLRWRYLQSKGLDYSEALTTYERRKDQGIARSGGQPKLSVTGRYRPSLRVNIPDGDFPGPGF